MIQLWPQMRVFVFKQSVDFRNGIDGLVGLTKSQLHEDPLSGSLYLFCNKKRTAFKGVIYDGQGFWLFMKRLSEGKFRHWPHDEGESKTTKLLARELSVLIWNGDPRNFLMAKDWKSICNDK